MVKRETRELSALTIGQAVEKWVASRVTSGSALASTTAAQRQRVRGMLGEVLALPIGALTDRHAQRLYAQHVERGFAVASHRYDKQLAEQLWRWAQRRGIVAGNPWESVEGLGRPNRGRAQLRPSESARFIEQAQSEALAGDPIAVAALCCLLLGLRANEALALVARDIDPPFVFVTRGKTHNAKRRLSAPDLLLDLLSRLTAGKGPGDRLVVASRQALWHRTQAICRRAGVAVVCVHGLRGSWASSAVASGVSLGDVSRALGHGSAAVTAAHYVTPEAAHNAQIAAFERSLHLPNRSVSPAGI